MNHKIARYGWKKDEHDERDHLLFGDVMPVQVMPESVDLRPNMPPIWNQYDIGCCTGFGVARVIAFDLLKQKLPYFEPSQLFIYYNERVIEGTVNQDSGAQIRDGIKSVSTLGVCDSKYWPYDTSKLVVKPTSIAYGDALKTRAVNYKKVINTRGELLRLCLANGFPFVFGFRVFESFEGDEIANTGIMPMPQPNEEEIGGHCVVGSGYLPFSKIINGERHYIIANSWGEGWGDKGYFYMPEKFITNPMYCSDFWAVNVIT